MVVQGSESINQERGARRAGRLGQEALWRRGASLEYVGGAGRESAERSLPAADFISGPRVRVRPTHVPTELNLGLFPEWLSGGALFPCFLFPLDERCPLGGQVPELLGARP